MHIIKQTPPYSFEHVKMACRRKKGTQTGSAKQRETSRNAEGASQAEKITKGYGVQTDVSVLQLNNATANTAATGNKRYVWQMRNYNW